LGGTEGQNLRFFKAVGARAGGCQEKLFIQMCGGVVSRETFYSNVLSEIFHLWRTKIFLTDFVLKVFKKGVLQDPTTQNLRFYSNAVKNFPPGQAKIF